MSFRTLSGSLTSLGTALAIALAAHPAQAVVLIDDTFTTEDGYVDGKLQFQNPNGDDPGTWLGQFNAATGNPSVDTTTGTVNVIGGQPGADPPGNAFLRNLWSAGATGTLAGGGSDEVGAGFSEGDMIKVGIDYQFNLAGPFANTALFVSGVTDCFATCGFDATPVTGIEAYFAEFESGALKVYTNFDRLGFDGADNAFAVIIPSEGIGIDLGFNPDTGMKDLPTDLESDTLRFSYEATLTDASQDLWTPTELVIENLDTGMEVGRATVDNPDALEPFFYNTNADDPFTIDVNEAGVAKTTGTEMFFGTRWIDSTNNATTAASSGVRFEYIPVPGPPVEGDYNGDGFVDAADYTVWRDLDGIVGPDLAADGTGDDDLGVPDGDVDQFDYQYWANRFGTPAAAAAGVPEPGAVVLAMVGVLVGCVKRRG